jgi:hypothetical protein
MQRRLPRERDSAWHLCTRRIDVLDRQGKAIAALNGARQFVDDSGEHDVLALPRCRQAVREPPVGA